MTTVSTELIDEAVIRLRRLWAPLTAGRAAAGNTPAVDLSTILVVDAVHRLGPGTSINPVADHIGVAQTTASRLVQRAVSGGFVARKPSRDDVRRAHLTLTRQGEMLLRESLHYRHELLQRLLDGWTDKEIGVFASQLSRFAAAVVDLGSAPVPQHRVPRGGAGVGA